MVMEKIFFYILIFFIPLQARMVLFPWLEPFNQWTSGYLYGTDILLAAVFFLWALRILKAAKIPNSKATVEAKLGAGLTPHRNEVPGAGFLIPNKIKNYIFQITKYGFLLTVFLIISVLSILNAQIKSLAWYQLLKLAEFVGFYFYLQKNLGKIFSLRGVLGVIAVSGFAQAVLGIVQYMKQGSIGLYFLGESPLSVNSMGVAVFFADGLKYLRAYGLTPHPNILAAWLFAAVFAFYFIYLEAPQAIRYRTEMSLVVHAVLLFGLFFTFSRVVVGLWALGVLASLFVVLLRKNFRGDRTIRRRTLELAAASLTVVVIFSALFRPQVKSRLAISPNEEAVTQRVFYNKAATQITEGSPWLGVGLGQFVPEMMGKFKKLPANAYQPVHNIYLLMASETGFLGLGAFLAFLILVFWKFIQAADFSKLRSYSFLLFAFSFLIIGLFDHFLWTSQQGSFLFWMSLALISPRSI